MADYLPEDRDEALRILTHSLGPPIEESELKGMEVFRYLPHVFFVAEHGLDHFETAMTMQYEITKRFTAEFSIRAYLEHHEHATLARLREWASDPNVHVRRLVSEGSRPRLPWAPRLRRFQDDPAPVIDLLEMLKDDPEEYVRRSVANNLNDIAKDHPDTVVEVARRWWADGDAARHRLVRHGLRTLIKQAHPGALAVLGYDASSPVEVGEVRVTPRTTEIGGSVRVEVDVVNPSEGPGAALADLIVHFVKANGSHSPKVFKGGEFEVDPGGTATFRKTISLKQHSTRTHYPGTHRVEVQLNGATIEGGSFELR
jgi:3-methyladenine DNA glycosylase AlkC